MTSPTAARVDDAGPAVAVVIPVRDMATHLTALLARLMPQVRPDDEVVVVDDGSRDDSGVRAAEAGTVVVRNEGGGPYRARNLGAARTSAPLILFLDARSRPQPGFLAAHRAILAADGAALSCTDVAVAPNSTLAGRIARAQDSWRLRHKITGSVLDFSPTANLGVTRRAFDAVGGFRDVRSGADADFCWRVQRAGLGALVGDARELMQWEPREQLTALVEQNYRYGRSSVYLERLHAATIAAARPSTGAAASRVVNPSSVAPRSDEGDPLAEFGARALNLAVRTGRLRGRWEYRGVEADDGVTTVAGGVAAPSPPARPISSWRRLRADIARYREDTWVSRYFWWITESSIWAVVAYRAGGALRELLPAFMARPVLAAYELTVMPIVRLLSGVELPLGVEVGPGLRIYHGTGVVLGGHAVVGARCVIRQGVNIGHVLGSADSPRIGDDVDLGAYAQVLGGVRIGDGARIGPHSVVFRDVPDGATAFGVPARVTSTGPTPRT